MDIYFIFMYKIEHFVQIGVADTIGSEERSTKK